MYEFDEDTAVRVQADGSYRGIVTDRWSVGDRPNGGYLMAIGLRAMSETLAQPDPLTVTTHFLRSPAPGPVAVEVEVVRKGRTVETAEARLHAGDREYVRMLATFGDLRAAAGPTRVTLRPPELPDVDDCVPLPPDGKLPDGTTATIMQRFDIRMTPESVGWVVGRPSERAEAHGWVRFRDDRPVDLVSLVQVLDAFAPAVLVAGHRGSVPTIELTTHFRAHPVPGWLRLATRTNVLVDGYLEEEAEVWDAGDRLVAQARQFARLAGAGEG